MDRSQAYCQSGFGVLKEGLSLFRNNLIFYFSTPSDTLKLGDKIVTIPDIPYVTG